jgi:hypothetical protein
MKFSLPILLFLSVLACAQSKPRPATMQWFDFSDYSIGIAVLDRTAPGGATTDLALRLHGDRSPLGKIEFSAIVFDDVNRDGVYQEKEARSRRDASWSDGATRVLLPGVSLFEQWGSPWVHFRIRTGQGEQTHTLKVPE